MVGVYGGLLLPLILVPKVIFPFVFSKLLFFQILIGLTFPAYLALAWMDARFRPRWVPLYSAIAAYFVTLSLSVVFAVDPLRAWWGNQERMNGLFTLLHFFAWFTMAIALLPTWREWRRIILFEIALSGFMAVVALLQIPFPRLLLFPAGNRVGGLLDNPIYMAAYQIFNLFFIALIWLKGASRTTKWWLVAFAVLDIAAFIATQSRGGLLGLAIGVLVFSVSYAVMVPNRKIRIGLLAVVVSGVLGYGLLFTFRETSLIRESPLYRLTDLHATTETRFLAWKIAWQGFLERPLTGWGLDDFHILFNQKYNPASLRFGYYETWFDRSHNTVMDMLSMTGIIGFVTYIAMFVALFWSVVRAYRRKWIDAPMASVFFALPVAYFAQNLFVFDQPAGFTMSFFMYALIARATTAGFSQEGGREDGMKSSSGASSIPWVVFGVVQAAALLIVWRYSVLPAKASYVTIASNNAFSQGMYSKAYVLAKTASEIPTPYLDEQTFLQSRNLISLVDRGEIEKVAEWRAWHDLVQSVTLRHLADHGRNTHPHFIYARFLQSFAKLVPEDAALAEAEYKKAIETSPKRQQLFFSLGRLYIEQGRSQEGYETFKQALDADPGVGESHWYVGLALIYDLNRRQEGSQHIVEAMRAPAPYTLKDAREAVALAQAYADVQDRDGFKSLMSLLPTLPNGSLQYYLDIARSAELLGLLEERNLILGALSKNDPTLAARLLPLTNGSVTSIEASLRETESSTAIPTFIPESVSSTPVTNGSGPRR
jgi:O-antigen ligase/tetratricopeptide (TPR) repeat protein